jgi:hypothetical protein
MARGISLMVTNISGARWDVLVGWETLTEIFDIHSYVMVITVLQYIADFNLYM